MVASPRTAGIGSRRRRAVGELDVGGELRRDVGCRRPHAATRWWPARRTAPPRPRSSGARHAGRAAASGPTCSATSVLTRPVRRRRASAPSRPVGPAAGRRGPRWSSSSLASDWACSSRLSVVTVAYTWRRAPGTRRRGRCTRAITASAASPSAAVTGRGSMARTSCSSNSATSRSASGAEPLQRVGERACVERLVDVGDAPAREVVGGRWLGGEVRHGRLLRVRTSPAKACRRRWTVKPRRSYSATAAELSAST